MLIFLDTEGCHLHNAFDQILIALLSLINEKNKYAPALTGKNERFLQCELYVRDISRLHPRGRWPEGPRFEPPQISVDHMRRTAAISNVWMTQDSACLIQIMK